MASSRSDAPIPGQMPIRWGRVLLAPAVFALTSLAGLALLRIYPASIAIPWTGLLMLAVAGLLFGLATLGRHHQHWRRPLRQLELTLEQVHQGQVAISHLDNTQGPLSGLAQQIQQIMRETRQLRAQISQRDQEMQQRLAQRTEALERTIGSLKLAANRDSMTGLYNRRMFDQHLEVVVKQATDEGADLCLIMLDLDNFKLLNDTAGHAAGDAFLRSVGQLIRSAIRQQDYGFRCGGDEFVIVLPGADKQAGQTLATRLMTLVDALGRTIKLDRPVGMSAGVATLWELRQPQWHDLLATADRRLYAAKAARKNVAPLLPQPSAKRRESYGACPVKPVAR